MSHMAWNYKRLSPAWCILPFILSNNPLRLCTISIQIPEIIWAGLSITFWNTFKHRAFQIYQIVILLTNCHIWGLSVCICGFKGIKCFSIKPCLITIASWNGENNLHELLKFKLKHSSIMYYLNFQEIYHLRQRGSWNESHKDGYNSLRSSTI